MTSLIDVIFLLLLFFMLSSTFTRLADIPLTGATAGGEVGDRPLVFLRLGTDGVLVNGRSATLDEAAQLLTAQTREGPRLLLITTQPGVTTQRLVDLMVALDPVPDMTMQVLR